jgi:transposase
MVSSVGASVVDDVVMSRRGPRAGGPRPRRTFSPAEKLAHLGAYDLAVQSGQGGAYLRREGLYSSQLTEWRKLRDGGLLDGKPAGAVVGRPNADQAENALLRAQLSKAERRATRAEAALEIMGKVRGLLEEISEGEPGEQPPTRR